MIARENCPLKDDTPYSDRSFPGGVSPDARQVGRVRRWSRRLAGPMTAVLVALNVLGLVGYVARDRTVALALMLYLPLMPLGLAALVLDLARRGRSLPGCRFGLAAIGLAGAAASGNWMIGHGPDPAPVLPGIEVRLLQWNVLWSGGRWWGGRRWEAMAEEIGRQGPDVIVLSEAPPVPKIADLARRLGEHWSWTTLENPPKSSYWCRLIVLSRWSTRLERREPIPSGSGMVVRVDRPGRAIRLLVVDGQSRPTRLRTPLLRGIASICDREADAGRPIDAVLGDFNSVSRSLGFDDLARAADGYRLASRRSRGWRGSWPSPCPIFDIDHVWVGAGARVLACELFSHYASDHRGQVVRMALSAARPELRTAP